MQDSNELHISLHIVDTCQESERYFDLYSIEKVLGLFDMGIYRALSQRAAHYLASAFYRPEKYRYISCTGFSYNTGLGIVEFSAYDFLYEPGDILSFRLFLAELLNLLICTACLSVISIIFLFSRFAIEDMDLRNEVVFRRTVPDAGIQHGTLVIAFHDAAENMVDVSDRSIVGPEIAAQIYCDALRFHASDIPGVQSLKYLRFGLSEFVNALLYVSYPEHVIRARNAAYQALLYVICILIFIDENKSESSAKSVSRLIILEYADCYMLHVSKVYDPLLTLFGVISPFELLEHTEVIYSILVC